MSLEPYTILRGAIYSMEAALSFLRDAIWLYRNQRYASAAILGATATEHMGRTIWLIGKRQAADSGEVLDLKRFKTA